MAPINLGLLSSGRETGLQAIVRALKQGHLDAKVAIVVSDLPEAPVIAWAKGEGIPVVLIDRRSFKGNREGWEREAVKVLRGHGVDLVVFAGFLRLASPYFLNEFRNRIINTHPSLMPAFPGKYAQKQALDHGVRVTGWTIHFVDETIDGGPIILQKAVPVLPDDTVETLSARILEQERVFLPLAIRLFAEGRLTIDGRRVHIRTDGFHLPPMA